MSGETFGQALRRLRQEHGLSLRRLQALARYDFTYLGQVERGEKPGSIELAITCDRALGLAGELIEIYRRSSTAPARFTDEEDDMHRRAAMKALASTPLVFAVGAGGHVEAEIARLERNSEIYRHLYHGANSPADLLGLVRDHLDTTVDLLRRLPDGPSRIRVLRNRSEIGTLAGRLAFFDLDNSTQARGFYGLAHEAATQADDHALAAAALGHLAFVPAREGNIAAAVDYLCGAADHARRTDAAALRSWVAAVEAELLTRSTRARASAPSTTPRRFSLTLRRTCPPGLTTTRLTGCTASAAIPCSRSAGQRKHARPSPPRWANSRPLRSSSALSSSPTLPARTSAAIRPTSSMPASWRPTVPPASPSPAMPPPASGYTTSAPSCDRGTIRPPSVPSTRDWPN